MTAGGSVQALVEGLVLVLLERSLLLVWVVMAGMKRGLILVHFLFRNGGCSFVFWLSYARLQFSSFEDSLRIR